MSRWIHDGRRKWARNIAPSLALAICGCAQSRSLDAVAQRSVQPSASAPSEPMVNAGLRAAEAAETDGRIRQPSIAGSWYPEERSLVLSEVGRMLRAARTAPALNTKPIALIVPHAGWRYSGIAAAAAFRNLHRGDFARVVLIGPSHSGAFEGFSLPDLDAYRTPVGDVPLCRDTPDLRDQSLLRDVPSADRGEHSLEIELPFLQHTLGSFCLVPILVGQTSPASERALAQKLAKLHDGKTLFVISSDFVHYGPRYEYTPFGPSASSARGKILDLENKAIGLLQSKDAAGFRELVHSSGATICGYRGQAVLLELLPRIAPQAHAVLLAHYSSGDVPDSHDDNTVGYVALAYVDKVPADAARPLTLPPQAKACGSDAAPLDAPTGQHLLQLARATLATELTGTDDLSRELRLLPDVARLDCMQAVFVTLKEDGQLRGCVGQVTPQFPLAQAVVRAAVDAALHDGRFEPVSAKELALLSYELTALSAPRSVPSWHDIVLGKHGIVLSEGGRRALFLPQVPGEQGWNVTQTLQALSTKAGLPEDAWRAPDAQFSVFTGQVFDQERALARTGPNTRRAQR